MHVLVSDREAEHVPGCNMSFRRSALEAVNGFDARYRVAGDDVDLCWRLSERGLRIGFHAGAMVWHHRRNSLRTYWKQQQGYGKAEALLEDKWPQRYNAAGHTAWAGRIYGTGLTRALTWGGGRIYQGVWGMAPFQSLYERQPGTLGSLALMPEWFLVVLGLAVLSVLAPFWTPLVAAVPLLALALALPVIQAWRSAGHARFTSVPPGGRGHGRLRAVTAMLHLIQPVARLRGRIRHGLTLWRRRGGGGPVLPLPHAVRIWSEEWRSAEQRLGSIEADLAVGGAVVRRGGALDRWDLELRGGLFGSARLRMAVEEHGGGRQLVRIRAWPRWSPGGPVLAVVLAVLTFAAFRDGAAVAGGVLAAFTAFTVLWVADDGAWAMGGVRRALGRIGGELK